MKMVPRKVGMAGLKIHCNGGKWEGKTKQNEHWLMIR
jgi:hypothetical protein